MQTDHNALISVVIPVRHARATASATLQQLLDAGEFEVIAVVSRSDPTTKDLRELKRRRAELVLIETETECSVPQLRARGIEAARGSWVAISEDHCRFPANWPRMLLPALQDAAIGAAGGPVANGRRESITGWAIYFSRYAANMPPLAAGPHPILPGNNACYRRELLDQLQPLWRQGFWEHDIHQELLRRGLKLWVVPNSAVEHHKPYRFGPYCRLRFLHGRCYGGMKRQASGLAAVAPQIALSPLIPALMALRSARAVFAKQTHQKEYLLSLPLLIILYSAWAAGELAGYLFGSGQACSQTD